MVSGKFIEVVNGIELEYDLYKYLTQYIDDKELESYLSAVKKPPSRYYVRVNEVKISPDDLIRLFKAHDIRAYRDEFLDEAVWIPVEGPNRVESARKYIVADKYAAESVYLGSNLYGPGVLYMPNGIEPGDEVNVLSPRGDVIAYGVAKVGSSGFRRGFRGIVVEVVSSVYRLPKLRDLPEWGFGLFYEQSMPAQWVGRVVEPKANELIVDMCAAPGGKATHIAQLSKNEARVVAVDRSWPKVTQLDFNAARLGLRLITLMEDSRYLDVKYPELVGNVDAVLLDPPCTDMGVRPKLYYRLSMKDVENASNYQRQFIKVAARLLKRGGRLIYSTCTLPPLENEDNVKWAEGLGLSIEDVRIPVGSTAFDSHSRRFYPHIHDSPGFFIAKLAKSR